jgi:hypothetical protein
LVPGPFVAKLGELDGFAEESLIRTGFAFSGSRKQWTRGYD